MAPSSISLSMAEPQAPEAWNGTTGRPASARRCHRRDHRAVGVAEGRYGDGLRRRPRGELLLGLGHADHGGRGLGQHALDHGVGPAEQVPDGEEHRDIAVADVFADVARGDRRDDELGRADRQRPHRDRGYGRALVAAHTYDAGELPGLVPLREEARRALPHRAHRLVAAAGGAQLGHAGAAHSRYLLGRDVGQPLGGGAQTDIEDGG